MTSNARVMGCSKVFGDALVGDEAVVKDQAFVNGCSAIRGRAIISEYAKVTDMSFVSGYAVVDGTSIVCGDVRILENARVTGESKLRGSGYIDGNAVVDGADISISSIICGDSYIKSLRDILVFEGPVRCDRTSITFTRRKSGGCYVCSNIATGDISDFRKAVLGSFTPGNPWYGRNEFVRDYYGTPDFLLEIIKFAERHFDIAPRRVEVRKVVKAHGR